MDKNTDFFTFSFKLNISDTHHLKSIIASQLYAGMSAYTIDSVSFINGTLFIRIKEPNDKHDLYKIKKNVVIPLIELSIYNTGRTTDSTDIIWDTAYFACSCIDIGTLQDKFDAPLPIKLISFAVQRNTLSWQTASESDSKSFLIERSFDGITFGKIAEIPAAGHSNAIINYSWEDNDVTQNTAYYRLKLEDQDGTYTYSDVVISIKQKLDFDFYPNPATDVIRINSSEHVRIQILDFKGKVLLTENCAGVVLNLDLSSIPPGVYMLQIIDDSAKISTKQLIKL